MKQPLPKDRFRNASLRQHGSARTVLLRMAADQERADRIRTLKQERPHLTWRRIADAVGVSERAVIDWQKTGGLEYENAKKLAEVFEVDVDYVWKGPADEDRAPSPFAARDGQEDRLAEMEARLSDQAEFIRGLLEKQNELLERQPQILERIERAVEAEEAAAARLSEADDAIVDRIARLAAEAARQEPEVPARERRTRATSPTPPD